MSLYTSRTDYFLALAQHDPVLRHLVGGRVSFFATDEDTVLSAVKEKVELMFAWYDGFRVGAIDTEGSLNRGLHHSVKFYGKVIIDEGHLDVHTAKEKAYADTFDMSEHWMKRILSDGYDDGLNKTFHKIDTGSVMVSKLPMFADMFVGWILTFSELRIDEDLSIPEAGYWTL